MQAEGEEINFEKALERLEKIVEEVGNSIYSITTFYAYAIHKYK